MCGITGYISYDSKVNVKAFITHILKLLTVDQMTKALWLKLVMSLSRL